MHTERDIPAVEDVISFMPIYDIPIPYENWLSGATLIDVLLKTLKFLFNHRYMEPLEFFIDIQFVHCTLVF